MFLLCLHSVFAGCFTYLCDFHWEQAWKSWDGLSHGVKNPTEIVSEVHEDDTELYCTCRKPWQGRFMIMCDFCEEWYHGSCVNITPTEALDIVKYKCGTCKGRPQSDGTQ